MRRTSWIENTWRKALLDVHTVGSDVRKVMVRESTSLQCPHHSMESALLIQDVTTWAGNLAMSWTSVYWHFLARWHAIDAKPIIVIGAAKGSLKTHMRTSHRRVVDAITSYSTSKSKLRNGCPWIKICWTFPNKRPDYITTNDARLVHSAVQWGVCLV